MNNGIVFGAYAYKGKKDELSFDVNAKFVVIRKNDDDQIRWWMKMIKTQNEGYVPRNLLAVLEFIIIALTLSTISSSDGIVM